MSEEQGNSNAFGGKGSNLPPPGKEISPGDPPITHYPIDHPKRGIVEHFEFQASVDELYGDFRIMEQVREVIDHTLQTEPWRLGRDTRDADIKAIPLKGWGRVANAALYYQWDATQVYLLKVGPQPDA